MWTSCIFYAFQQSTPLSFKLRTACCGNLPTHSTPLTKQTNCTGCSASSLRSVQRWKIPVHTTRRFSFQAAVGEVIRSDFVSSVPSAPTPSTPGFRAIRRGRLQRKISMRMDCSVCPQTVRLSSVEVWKRLWGTFLGYLNWWNLRDVSSLLKLRNAFPNCLSSDCRH